MKKKSAELTDSQILTIADELPWYGVVRPKRVRLAGGGTVNELDDKTFRCIGPDLLKGFIAEHKRSPFKPGFWLIGTWIPATQQTQPDWGSLTVRGPGSWVLRSRDGRKMWSGAPGGAVVCLKGGGS